MKLTNKVAIVTGGNKGIGKAISLRLAEEGADVVIAARDTEAADEVVRKVEQKGRHSLSVKTDVMQSDQVEAMVKKVMDEFGRIDILVNNAGQILKVEAAKTKVADWDNIINVNVRGTFLCSRTVLPHMIRRRGGKIINISSTAGKRGTPEVSAYCASKFAVSGFSESIAQEVAKYGITVNSICPGMVLTKMGLSVSPETDTSKWLTPEDIADVVVFLATRPSRVLIPEMLVLASDVDYFRQ